MKNRRCFIEDCYEFSLFQVKMLVLHPTCKRWQTWNLCENCIKQVEIDKFRQKHGLGVRFGWKVRYKYKKINPERPVIEIGEIKPLVFREIPL